MPGVSLIAEATQRSVGVVGAVASGAGECLELEPEMATRLNAIAIEAASNVVAHAYPGSSGPLELEISAPEEDVVRDLTIVVRDCGGGLFPAPVPTDSAGLGLTMICALADEVEISSSHSRGTAIEAKLQASGEDVREPLRPAPDSDPRIGGSLSFDGGAFVESVLPRALTALVAGSTTAMDVLGSVLRAGDAIAYGLDSVLAVGTGPNVSWDGDSPREVRIGPLPRGGAGKLVAAVAALGRPLLELAPNAAGDYACFDLPQNQS